MEENKVEESKRRKTMKNGASLAGAFWFAGWLFSIGFAHLVWWKIILGIVVWPYFLGTYMGG